MTGNKKVERKTIQRSIIETELESLANHPTAEEVYAAVHKKHPSIGKATVYRTLSKMAEDGSALCVKINNGANHFDHQTHPHFHVRCTRCGRVDDVDIKIAADIVKRANKNSSYDISDYSLQFDGICPECLKAGGKATKA